MGFNKKIIFRTAPRMSPAAAGESSDAQARSDMPAHDLGGSGLGGDFGTPWSTKVSIKAEFSTIDVQITELMS
jgi:hypothetical protein